jgi:hypothetical protein
LLHKNTCEIFSHRQDWKSDLYLPVLVSRITRRSKTHFRYPILHNFSDIDA